MAQAGTSALVLSSACSSTPFHMALVFYVVAKLKLVSEASSPEDYMVNNNTFHLLLRLQGTLSVISFDSKV